MKKQQIQQLVSQQEINGEDSSKEKENVQSSTNSDNESNLITTELKAKTILGTDNEDINWDLIEEEIETLDTSWSVILLDLYNTNSENKDILGFSDKLNDAILSIENRDKKSALINLRDLYSYIPRFLEASGINGAEQKIKQAKVNLINAYVSANEEDWEMVKEELLNCELQINNISNDMDYIENREYKANKMYILTKEIEKSINIKDKKIFYMKYKNLLQSINSIT